MRAEEIRREVEDVLVDLPDDLSNPEQLEAEVTRLSRAHELLDRALQD